jgi:multiple sugar transport system ATP-binding protein
MSKADRREAIEQTAAKVDIPDLLDKHPPQLSGGEKQRVALGRAIVRDPSVFLMDEPLSNLDAKLRRTMRTELEALQDDLGVTTVYVTHNQTEAMTMGDRIVVLKDARVQQVGTPLECYLEPQNQFVAGFIGDPPMNMLEGAVDGSTFQSDAGEYRLSPEIETALDGHDHVTLGIRPEDIELTTDPQDAQHVQCTVRMIEEMGAIQHIYVETDPGGRELIILADGKEPITEGDTYAAVLPQENVHFFNTESGTALHNCMLRDEREAKLELSRRDVTMS